MGCIVHENSTEKLLVFNWYNSNDSLLKNDAFKLNIYSGNDFDSIIGIANDKFYFAIKQVLDSSGIYRFCQNEKIKTHSLTDSLITAYCKNLPPFINENVSFRGRKTYQIENKKYTVYHFIESYGNHTVYDSYFIDEMIPICYYSFDRDSYIFCDTIQGYDVNNRDLKELKIKLLSDSFFYARYYLQKQYPNYYRPKRLYNYF